MRSKHYVRGRKLERGVERAARRIGEELTGAHRRILSWSAAGWSQVEIARALGSKLAYVDSVLRELTERLRTQVGYYASKREMGRVFTFHDERDTVAFAEERGWLGPERPRNAEPGENPGATADPNGAA